MLRSVWRGPVEVSWRWPGVSRSWLYRQPDLRADIDRLRRVATTQAVPIPPAERGSAQSLQQRLNRRPRRNHQTQNRQSPTPTTPRPTPRPPAPKPPPHPVNDMSPTRNPSSEPQKRQVLQITVNNLIKRVKRTAFGFRRFANYRIRALLYADKPMRVRIEVGSTGGGGSQTRAPPCGGGFPVECLPAGDVAW